MGCKQSSNSEPISSCVVGMGGCNTCDKKPDVFRSTTHSGPHEEGAAVCPVCTMTSKQRVNHLNDGEPYKCQDCGVEYLTFFVGAKARCHKCAEATDSCSACSKTLGTKRQNPGSPKRQTAAQREQAEQAQLVSTLSADLKRIEAEK